MLIYCGAALLLTGAVLILGPRLRPPTPWVPPQLRVIETAAPQPPARLTLDQLAVVWQRDLRQPVVDPPPASPPAAPQLALRLEATAVEAQQRYGVFRLADSRMVLRPIGAVVDGFELVAVEPGRAVLRNAQQEFVLTVPWYDRIVRGLEP